MVHPSALTIDCKERSRFATSRSRSERTWVAPSRDWCAPISSRDAARAATWLPENCKADPFNLWLNLRKSSKAPRWMASLIFCRSRGASSEKIRKRSRSNSMSPSRRLNNADGSKPLLFNLSNLGSLLIRKVRLPGSNFQIQDTFCLRCPLISALRTEILELWKLKKAVPLNQDGLDATFPHLFFTETSYLEMKISKIQITGVPDLATK